MKFQRNNQQKALAIGSNKGKLEKKAVFSPRCGDETTAYYNGAFGKHSIEVFAWRVECINGRRHGDAGEMELMLAPLPLPFEGFHYPLFTLQRFSFGRREAYP